MLLSNQQLEFVHDVFFNFICIIYLRSGVGAAQEVLRLPPTGYQFTK
jgi:hypothetical protein